jgi:hypothetical integral membrane protein (TIGR02206 family)
VDELGWIVSPHAIAVACSVALAAWVSVTARRRPATGEVLRIVVAVVVLGSELGTIVLDAAAGVPWTEYAPFHLCDASAILAAVALLSRRQLPGELLYFWGLAGSVPALLTPDLAQAFPHPRFVLYFVQHGGVVVAAVLWSAGLGGRPRERAVWRALLWLNGYAAIVALVNVLGDANFLYLMRKPGVATPLDWFGPWPLYLLGGELIALVSFRLLAQPFVGGRSAAGGGAKTDSRS